MITRTDLANGLDNSLFVTTRTYLANMGELTLYL